MTVTRVKTTAGWVDLTTVGPKGDKGDPGYYEYGYVAGGGVVKNMAIPGGTWGSADVPTAQVVFNQPVGAFSVNADGSLTVRDAGLYDIEASVTANVAWSSAVRLITSLGTGPDAISASDTIARADAHVIAGGYPSTTLAGSIYLAAGSKVWVTYFAGSPNNGTAAVTHFSIVRVGAGPQGPKGDQGVVAAYAQPNDPGVVANGTLWIDTDAGVAQMVTSSVAQAYAMTAGYTKDRAMNPAATTINEVANVLATLIDDMRAAGLINP